MPTKKSDRRSFYENAINRFLTLHKGEDLETFCRRQRISYRRVMDALSSDATLYEAYQLHASEIRPAVSDVCGSPVPLRPLILDGAPSSPAGSLRGVFVRFPDGCRIQIRECDADALLSILSGKGVVHA